MEFLLLVASRLFFVQYRKFGFKGHPLLLQTTSENQYAIQVENLSKCFETNATILTRLKTYLFLGLGLKRLVSKDIHQFWSLREISFAVKKGEAYGIVGRNGAGKSTLLQIIAGTMKPSKGRVFVHGRVNALLELGSGFNPEFTGRENAYLNGSLLGFSKKEISERMEEIIEFSEIGDFIDRPVKTYSSGMFVRLAFSVQALLEPEILIVDEALSVGDVFFVQKCHAKIESLLKSRKITFLFVTHDLAAIEKYCDRALLLEKGQIVLEGNKKDVIAKFYRPDLRITESKNEGFSEILRILGESESVELQSLSCQVDGVEVSKVNIEDVIHLRVCYKFKKGSVNPVFDITFKDTRGVVILCTNNRMLGQELILSMGLDEVCEVSFRFQNFLAAGKYTVSLGVALNSTESGNPPSDVSFEDVYLLEVFDSKNYIPQSFGLIHHKIIMEARNEGRL